MLDYYILSKNVFQLKFIRLNQTGFLARKHMFATDLLGKKSHRFKLATIGRELNWSRIDCCPHHILFYNCELEFLAFRLLPNPTQRGHLFYPYPACIEAADRELLPCTSNWFYEQSKSISNLAYHEVSVYPKKEFPLWTVFASLISFCVAIFAIVFHQYPDETITITTNFLHWVTWFYATKE